MHLSWPDKQRWRLRAPFVTPSRRPPPPPPPPPLYVRQQSERALRKKSSSARGLRGKDGESANDVFRGQSAESEVAHYWDLYSPALPSPAEKIFRATTATPSPLLGNPRE